MYILYPSIDETKKRLVGRIRRIRGQAEALENALHKESECAAVLQQIAAIRGVVNGLMAEVLEGHFREHLGLGSDTDKDELDQVIRMLRSYMK
ncbi:MAG: metal/formaldehyde-sensitive transcriptional repressor [Burkholderiales bacterium]|nr:metal/formaldehyde-sensitive transcriptional repressor [Burkholderiales bacterium]